MFIQRTPTTFECDFVSLAKVIKIPEFLLWVFYPIKLPGYPDSLHALFRCIVKKNSTYQLCLATSFSIVLPAGTLIMVRPFTTRGIVYGSSGISMKAKFATLGFFSCD